MDIETSLAEYVRERQIPVFGIARADGFEHSWPGWHPKELMPRCGSVVVFGRPFVRYPLQIDEKTHLANESWWQTNDTAIKEVATWRGEIINLFDEFGLGTANFGGCGLTSAPTFSYRLAQYEAGIGVYGRFGVCLNPDFGSYYTVAVLLTEAMLAPSDRARLTGFAPCEGCAICAQHYSVRAIDVTKTPAKGYNRDLCLRFILKMKQRYGANAKICSRCFSACPWGAGSKGRHQQEQN